jgi:thiamine pyrophosphokinase
MHAVIFAGGTLQPDVAVAQALACADLIIAADRGTLLALQYGYTPALVVGDFDSLTLPAQELEARGCTIIRVAAEKDETDTELAIQAALEQGADTITLLGGLGGARFDHTLANIFLLAAFKTVPIRIVDGPMVCWLLCGPGEAHIHGRPGDLLSLFPFSDDAIGVSTSNLYYPLQEATLHFGKPRGVSNVLVESHAQVKLQEGMLLIVHTNRGELQEQH